MARAAQGSRSRVWVSGSARTLHARALSPVDVERLSPRARKVYLRRQLHDVEHRIDDMIDHLAEHAEASADLPIAAEPMMNAEHWSSLFDLGYLMAEREALAEVIARL